MKQVDINLHLAHLNRPRHDRDIQSALINIHEVGDISRTVVGLSTVSWSQSETAEISHSNICSSSCKQRR